MHEVNDSGSLSISIGYSSLHLTVIWLKLRSSLAKLLDICQMNVCIIFR